MIDGVQVADIISGLESDAAKIFWISFFKSSQGCASDEFFEAVR